MVLREVSPDPREERQRRMESHCTGKNILNNIHSLNKKQKTQATRGRNKNGPIQSPVDKCYLQVLSFRQCLIRVFVFTCVCTSACLNIITVLIYRMDGSHQNYWPRN